MMSQSAEAQSVHNLPARIQTAPTARPNKSLALWQKFSSFPFGKWLFSKLVCFKAPYFASISPRIDELAPGHCVVRVNKHRAVHNHIGTVHAIAICNMAELAAGTMTEVTVPPTHRWIPKGMSVEYLKKAATNLRGVATCDAAPIFGDAAFALPVHVVVTDTAEQVVFKASITMWITPKK